VGIATPKRPVSLVLPLLVLGALSIGCGDDRDGDGSAGPQAFSSPQFVGALEGGGLVAAVDDGAFARVFVCERDESGIAEWFQGEKDGDSVEVASASREATLEAELSDDAVTGTVTLRDGVTLSFSADPVTDGSGLYEVVRAPARTDGLSASGAELALRGRGERQRGTIELPTAVRSPIAASGPPAEVGTYVAVVDLARGDLCGAGSSTGVKRGRPSPALRLSADLSR